MSRAGILQITCANLSQSASHFKKPLKSLFFSKHQLITLELDLLERDKVRRPGEDGVLYELLARHPPDLEDLKMANLQVGGYNQTF